MVGAFAAWTWFWVKAADRAGQRAEERVQRIQTAQNMREAGLMTWEEANNYIITGHKVWTSYSDMAE